VSLRHREFGTFFAAGKDGEISASDTAFWLLRVRRELG